MAVDAKRRMLASAITLSRRHGIPGLAVREVLEHSGAARGSFYHYFPGGTADLAVESTRVAGAAISSVVAECCRRDPQGALAEFVRSWIALLEVDRFTQGCPIAAAALARHSVPAAADAADVAFAECEAAIAENLIRHGVADATARSLAITVTCAVEGAVVRCIAAKSVDPLLVTHRHLDQLLSMQLSASEI